MDGAWVFFVPQTGWTAWIADEAVLVYWDGAAWTHVTFVSAATAALFGVNTTADIVSRLSVKSDAVLFSHDDATPGSGDLRLSLNKDGAAQTASVVFQTGYSGRAEFGLAGDDDFHVKVSPDGESWHEALVIDRASGRARFPAGADGLPVGTVIWHAAASPPSGFLRANGAAISRTAYANLFDVIGTGFGAGDGSTTFNLPDLRGEFVRGVDDGRGVDPGRAFGSWQQDQFQYHTHRTNITGTPGSATAQFSYVGPGIDDETVVHSAGPVNGRFGGETRGRNVALLACIKY
ncbi:DUF2793 domain-containing protein [Amorphus sp. 3PC139-8]